MLDAMSTRRRSADSSHQRFALALLATCGAMAATLVISAVHASLDRDFGRDWARSLTVKNPEPLGEAAIRRYLKQRENAP